MMDDFYTWWRDKGQYIPPVDSLKSDEAKEPFKRFAQIMYIEVSEAWDRGWDAGIDEMEKP